VPTWATQAGAKPTFQDISYVYPYYPAFVVQVNALASQAVQKPSPG
jgi:hypothetical protein